MTANAILAELSSEVAAVVGALTPALRADLDLLAVDAATVLRLPPDEQAQERAILRATALNLAVAHGQAVQAKAVEVLSRIAGGVLESVFA